MSDQDPSVTATVAEIEAAAAGRWIAWLSDTDWWWASRTRTLTALELSAGCTQYIHADNPRELSERVRHQDVLYPNTSERRNQGADHTQRDPNHLHCIRPGTQ